MGFFTRSFFFFFVLSIWQLLAIENCQDNNDVVLLLCVSHFRVSCALVPIPRLPDDGLTRKKKKCLINSFLPQECAARRFGVVECQLGLFLGCAANPDVIPPTGYTDWCCVK